MTQTIYQLVQIMTVHRQELQTLVKKQIELKNLKRQSKTVSDLSNIQSSLSLRKKMINAHHESIAKYKAELSKYPRGTEGLKINANQLSELLTIVKDTYKKETSEQYKLKKSLSNGKNFGSVDDFALAQRQKMERKSVIQFLVEQRTSFKQEYKVVTDKLYNYSKAA